MNGFYQTVWKFFFSRHVINPRDAPLFHHIPPIFFLAKIITVRFFKTGVCETISVITSIS